ncbi:MAG: S41 family peptidase [Bacillota bacterium]|nr:S41 family peptidase [Bacillota bacterium]
MKKRNLASKILVIILVLAMIAGVASCLAYVIAPSSVNVYAANAVSDEDAYKKLDKLKDIIKIIKENYKEEIAVEKLVNGAYEGVFGQLDDWSVYYASTVEQEAFTNTLTTQQYCGVGLTITAAGTDCIIDAVNPKGPCKPAGIKAGDIITAVDGKPVKGWSLDQISQALRGKEGTKVKISTTRKGVAYDYTIVRAMLETTDIDSYIIPDTSIGYIEIASFGEKCANDFTEAVAQLREDGATSFIFDLRNNPGGYMDQALNCAACILKPGDDLVYYYQNGKEIDHLHVVGEDDSPRDKVVILVNENSASAAEVFTAALKGNNNATVVGVNTYGKGVAQEIIDLEDGSSFKLSTLYFTGPKKLAIDGKGIKPDYIVYNNDGFLTSEEAAQLSASFIPLKEDKKFQKKGEYGLNVLAAQQRLKAMGFEVETNSILDDATMAAIMVIQKDAGGTPYGGLDFGTMRAITARFNSYFGGDKDAQLEKAISLLK